jgi:putative FmdB family regulatory protein
MPTYEYICRLCDHAFETFQSMRDDSLTSCPSCGEEGLKRLIGGGAGIIFKGSGFYETDYKKKPAESSSSESTKTEKSSEASATSSSASSTSPSSSSGDTAK